MWLVFLGSPGSGKGTISELFVKRDKFIHLSTGNLFRNILNKKHLTKTQKQVQKLMNKGKLINDNLTFNILKEFLSDYDLNKINIILDGFPRTLKQAEFLGDFIIKNAIENVYFIKFDVSVEIIIDRLKNRLTCPTCNRIYHKVFSPPQKKWYCDDDGQKLLKREDDKEEMVRERFEEYLEKTLPIFDFYDERLIHIDASKSQDEIYQKIKRIIKN